MAHRQFGILDAPTSVAIGAAMDVGHASEVTIFFLGTWTAAMTIETSHDGTNWASEGNITGPFIKQLTSIVKFVRLNMTSYTSGTVIPTIGLQIS